MEMAEAITTSGQLSLKTAEKWVNEYLKKVSGMDDVDFVIYCDTDSIFINLEPLVNKVFGEEKAKTMTRDEIETFLDKLGSKKIEPVIEKSYTDLAERLGVFENKMHMKREKIADRAIFIKKKKYLASVLNSEGVHYDTPKISVTGLDAVRSSTPEICRKRMQETFKVMINGTEKELQEFIEGFRQEFRNYPVEEISKVSGANDLEKSRDKHTIYRKGTPIHIRGALLFNDFLKKKGLERKYAEIVSGDKVKFVYLKMPNPLKENVIAFVDFLPPEFGLHDYIDWETQFEKVFLNPVKLITDAIQWDTEEVATLDDFFS